MKIIDLSQEIFNGQPVYVGHPTTEVCRVKEIKALEGGRWTFAVNRILMSEHAGTHTDAFLHCDPAPGAKGIDEIEIDRFIGPGICLDLSGVPESEFITVKDLEEACIRSGLSIGKGSTVLIYTGTYQRHFPKPSYNEINAGLSREAVEWLADRGCKNIGIDAVSIDVSPHKGEEWKAAHTACLERGILNTENLGDLRPVAGKSFLYIGLPIKIQGGTAGPVRAVAVLDAPFDQKQEIW